MDDFGAIKGYEFFRAFEAITRHQKGLANLCRISVIEKFSTLFGQT